MAQVYDPETGTVYDDSDPVYQVNEAPATPGFFDTIFNPGNVQKALDKWLFTPGAVSPGPVAKPSLPPGTASSATASLLSNPVVLVAIAGAVYFLFFHKKGR